MNETITNTKIVFTNKYIERRICKQISENIISVWESIALSETACAIFPSHVTPGKIVCQIKYLYKED
jgi:hypothetical protein